MAKKVMTRAWEIVREAIANFGGKAAQYISEALRMAWKEVRMAGKKVIDRIEELEALGFKRWTKNGMDRLYVNASALGLNCEYYKTGNISDAWFDGDRISNSEARRMKHSKTYIDIKTEKIYSDNDLLAKKAAEISNCEIAM